MRFCDEGHSEYDTSDGDCVFGNCAVMVADEYNNKGLAIVIPHIL